MESQQASPATCCVEYGWRRAAVTTGIILATLLEIVDVTIVNVALPNIEGNFGTNLDEAAWISTGYIIANVIVIPLTPWLATRFGRKAYYLTSIGLFTFASVMCGLAPNVKLLILWRFVQGLGGGGLISTSQAILRETYPPDKQGMAAGVFAMGVVLGPTIGPVLGGMITDQASWRWAFLINLPLGIFAILLVWNFLRDPSPARKIPVDRLGLALLIVGIGALQYVLDQGQTKDWFNDDSILWCTIIAGLSLIGFVFWECCGTPTPIVDLRILRYRSVSAASLLGMVLGATLYGTVLILPQYLQNSLGFTATASGEVLVMRAATLLVFIPLTARLTSQGVFDPRWAVAIGFVLIGVGNFLQAAATTSQSAFWSFFIPLAFTGAGLAQIFVPLSLALFGSVEPRDVPAAAAFFNVARQLGGSIAVAVLVTILSRNGAQHQTDLAANVTLSRAPVAQYVAANGGFVTSQITMRLNHLVASEALIMAYADTARLVGTLSLALAPLALVLRRPRRLAAVHVE